MSFLDGLRYRLRVLLRPDEVESEMDEEQRFHMTLDSAQHSARRRIAFLSRKPNQESGEGRSCSRPRKRFPAASRWSARARS